MDRLLDQTRSGPFYLRQPELAEMVVKAIYYSATVLGHCTLHAYVVMPNHVHLLVSPAIALCKLTKSLKGITAKRANTMLALTGWPFWQEESYDHLVRNGGAFDKIRRYIEGESRSRGTGYGCQPVSVVERGMGHRGVARGPGGPPHNTSIVVNSSTLCD